MIAGNHEYYSGIGSWLPEFEKMGLKTLYNQHTVINPRGQALVLAGLTDTTALDSRFRLPGPDLEKALNGVPEKPPLILLEHRPVRAWENSKDARVDIQLSGHTHGGTMPILRSLVKRSNNGFLAGWYQVGRVKMYVHPGTGLWSGFPIRLDVPSEITLITFKS
jgi:predicted MPP superfamily phosphohydrolase